VERIAPRAQVVRNPDNQGFAPAVNLGASLATRDLLVILNPDARPAPGWAEGIRRPAERDYGWGAWMALVTSKDGETVNTNGGVVHFTGLAWAGEEGAPAPGSLHAPADVGFASGACLVVPLETWRRLGGFPGEYFIYHEDVEISLRIRLEGGRVGAEPAARVDHDYDFVKGERKWYLLERNRWATILRTYPAALLVLVAPALLATEVAILAVAAREGWWSAKLRAMRDVVRAAPRLLRERSAIQRGRTASAGEFATALSASLDSPYLGALARHPAVGLLSRGYWALVRLALGAMRT
jgi:GT2 family glycosyltransferase